MLELTCRKNLIALAKAYAEANDLSLATVSRRFHGNQAFFAEFGRGDCSITLSKLDEIVEAFRANWPTDARWPFLNAAVIPRPGIKVAGEKRARA